MNLLKKSVMALSAITLMFTGCETTSPEDYQSYYSDTEFPSNASVAEPTVDNGEEVRDVVAKDQNSMLPASNDSQSSSLIMTINNLYKTTEKLENNNIGSLSVIDSGTQECPSGGKYKYSVSGSMNDATITFEYDNCDMYGIFSYDGSFVTHATSYNEETGAYKYSTMEFTTDFNIQTSGQNMTIYKGGKMVIEVLSYDAYDDIDKVKMDISMITKVNGQKSGQKDASYIIDTDGYSTSMYQTKGKIYINNLSSYVEYDTSYDMSQTPFIFSSSGALTNGEAHYNMDGGKLKIIAENYQAKVYVDADNDGYFELQE